MLDNILEVPEHSRQVFQETIKLLKHKSLYFCLVQLIFDQYQRSDLQIVEKSCNFRTFWWKIYWPDLKFDNKSLIKRWNSYLIIEIMFWSFFRYQSLSNCSRLATRGGKQIGFEKKRVLILPELTGMIQITVTSINVFWNKLILLAKWVRLY